MARSDVINTPGIPEWYSRQRYDSLPSWYKEALDMNEYEPVTSPEDINRELEAVPPHARKDVVMNMEKAQLPGVGKGYRDSQIVNWSYYNSPIVNENRTIYGKSRKWGDIDPEGKKQVISMISEQARAAGLSPEDTAYVLAIAHIESGFNPDAAAGTTSAHGLGQFINRTGEHYGLNNENRWDINTQIRALIDHFQDNKKMAMERGLGEDYIYAFHHDGPSLAYGGLDISKRKVRPLWEMYKGVVS